MAAAARVAATLIALMGKAPKTAAIVCDTVKETFSDYSVAAILSLAVPIIPLAFLALISRGLSRTGLLSNTPELEFNFEVGK